MKILKYLLLLLILALFALSVFIATLKNDVQIEKSTFIKVSRNIVFDYVNQYQNWELWASWKEDDDTMKFIFPNNTSGKNSYVEWKGVNGEGKIETKNIVANQKIVMETDYNGNKYASVFIFKDSIGGTKVSWNIKGKANFFTKVTAAFSGGIKKVFGSIFERSLNNLNVVLSKEINDYKINVAGLITIPARYYVKSSIVCKPSEMQSKINLTLPKIDFFFKNNNIKMNGKPFVIKEYESADTLKIGVYGPLKEQIFISAGSDLTTGLMPEFTALKIVLRGDYSRLNEARSKAVLEFNKRQLRPSTTLLPMEVYFQTITESKKPSQWLTFIQQPIYTKPIFVPKIFKLKTKTVPVTEPIETEPTPEKEEF